MVLRLLTIEHTQRREDVSIECLAMFHCNKDPPLHHRDKGTVKTVDWRGENRVQNRQRQFHLQARLWRLFFVMPVGKLLLIISKQETQSTASIMLICGSV